MVDIVRNFIQMFCGRKTKRYSMQQHGIDEHSQMYKAYMYIRHICGNMGSDQDIIEFCQSLRHTIRICGFTDTSMVDFLCPDKQFLKCYELTRFDILKFVCMI